MGGTQGSDDAHNTLSVEFNWNGRKCTGTRLHEAALEGNLEQVSQILDANPEELTARFSYRTIFMKVPQEGSGEAIHLAASRGRIGVMELLLARAANLHAKVTRGGVDHYDVLHAAVFAEARNDNMDMVSFLLQRDAPILANADGMWPLHLAFRVGNLELIRRLRDEMRQRGLDEVEQITGSVPSPLLLGIRMGKMTTTELAKAAAHTPLSLHTFIQHEPRCIPRFLREVASSVGPSVTAWTLARHVRGADLARVLRRSPGAAGALFDAITTTPDVQHGGWHPLPRRISFARSSLTLALRDYLNPQKELLVHYVEESGWRYDVESFEAPKWHQDFRDPTCGTPVHDVQVQVCCVPGLLAAEFFSGLADVDPAGVGEQSIFEHSVVRGSITYVWWNGAWRVDVLHAALGVWSLGLLILESWLVGGDAQPLGAESRRLQAIQSTDVVSALGVILPSSALAGDIAVSAAFIGAKGITDVVHETAQFGGFICIGRPMDYFRDAGNLWDLFRGLMLMAPFFNTKNSIIRVSIIFILWMRLLEMFTSAEIVAVSLLPLKRLPHSLAPALAVMLVAFLAFAHAFHYVWGHDHNWEATFLEAFATLINAQLPERPWRDSPLELLVVYGAVLFFSIFMLNIFIGVISTAYDVEKSRVPQSFMHHRACCCLNFLLRARIFPCTVCSRLCANLVSLAAFGACVFTQVYSLSRKRNDLAIRTIFSFSQLVLLLAAYQTPNLPWKCQEKQDRYLWVTTAVDNLVKCPCGDESCCEQCGASRAAGDGESPRRRNRHAGTTRMRRTYSEVEW